MITPEERAMFEHVKMLLKDYDTNPHVPEKKVKYIRFDHTKRTFMWLLKLIEDYPDRESLDEEALRIATIFHDCGYTAEDRHNHPARSAVYCREYLESKDYPSYKIDFICDLISRHSDKDKMFDDIPMELVLLMEADLFDDTGAHGLVLDVWIEVLANEEISFESILKHFEKSLNIMAENPMRTAKAKEIWEHKRQIVNDFYEEYKRDILTI